MAENVFIICDGAVRAYASRIAPGAPLLSLDCGESGKTLQTVEDICRWLLSLNAGRDALLLAVGGGVITDLVGFTASVYKRGVRYANYPTTLLAMVDAALGGKTAVNVDGYKNMMGSFLEPEYVHYDLGVLETLPGREFRAGAVEMLKTFIIGAPRYYRRAVKVLQMPLDTDALEPLVRKAAAIKREIVAKDPFDGNLRRTLNLGHTWAHALEWKFPGRYLHGEAVAIGLVRAAEISVARGLCSTALPLIIREDLEDVGLTVDMPCPASELLPAILNDKKSGEEGTISEPLLRKIGDVVLTEMKPSELV